MKGPPQGPGLTLRPPWGSLQAGRTRSPPARPAGTLLSGLVMALRPQRLSPSLPALDRPLGGAYTDTHGTMPPLGKDTERPAQPPPACGSSESSQDVGGPHPSLSISGAPAALPVGTSTAHRDSCSGVTSRPGAGPQPGIRGHLALSPPPVPEVMQTGSPAGRNCATQRVFAS